MAEAKTRKKAKKRSAAARKSSTAPALEKAARKKAKQATEKRWSSEVQTDALDLDQGVFTWRDPRRIAGSLQRSAESSTRRKGTSLQSAMSMLNFYINRAGDSLDPAQRKVLEKAKAELRKRHGRE